MVSGYEGETSHALKGLLEKQYHWQSQVSSWTVSLVPIRPNDLFLHHIFYTVPLNPVINSEILELMKIITLKKWKEESNSKVIFKKKSHWVISNYKCSCTLTLEGTMQRSRAMCWWQLQVKIQVYFLDSSNAIHSSSSSEWFTEMVTTLGKVLNKTKWHLPLIFSIVAFLDIIVPIITEKIMFWVYSLTLSCVLALTITRLLFRLHGYPVEHWKLIRDAKHFFLVQPQDSCCRKMPLLGPSHCENQRYPCIFFKCTYAVPDQNKINIHFSF